MTLRSLTFAVLALWLLDAHAEKAPLPGESSPSDQPDSPAPADDRPEGEDGPAVAPLAPLDEPALTGLLIDRTVTMIGRTSFRQFGQLRLDSVALSNTNLVIHERPSARWESLVWKEFASGRVVQ